MGGKALPSKGGQRIHIADIGSFSGRTPVVGRQGKVGRTAYCNDTNIEAYEKIAPLAFSNGAMLIRHKQINH
jgi:hypothetical protein